MYRNKTVAEIQRRHELELRHRDRMIENLLDRLAALSGKPWTPSPSSMTPPAPEEPRELDYTWAPEHLEAEVPSFVPEGGL